MNKIRIIGTIDEAAYIKFSEELGELEDSKVLKVEVELSSGGGIAVDALAFAGRIRTSPIDISITGYGLVASAAVIILAAGDHRKLTKESWVMVHEDSIETEGRTSEIEDQAAIMRKFEEQWSLLLQEYTGTSTKVWDKLHKKETYLSAEECFNLKLIDEII